MIQSADQIQAEMPEIHFKVNIPRFNEGLHASPEFPFLPETMEETTAPIVSLRSVALDPTLSPPSKMTVGYADDLPELFKRQVDNKFPSPFPFLSLMEIEYVYNNIYYKLRTICMLPDHTPQMSEMLYHLVENTVIKEIS